MHLKFGKHPEFWPFCFFKTTNPKLQTLMYRYFFFLRGLMYRSGTSRTTYSHNGPPADGPEPLFLLFFYFFGIFSCWASPISIFLFFFFSSPCWGWVQLALFWFISLLGWTSMVYLTGPAGLNELGLPDWASCCAWARRMHFGAAGPGRGPFTWGLDGAACWPSSPDQLLRLYHKKL